MRSSLKNDPFHIRSFKHKSAIKTAKDEVMPEESESSLRQRITAYMSGDGSSRDNWFCTWWFRFHIEPFTTKQIRRELELMKREGLVESDHSQSNNTKWKLIKVTP